MRTKSENVSYLCRGIRTVLPCIAWALLWCFTIFTTFNLTLCFNSLFPYFPRYKEISGKRHITKPKLLFQPLSWHFSFLISFQVFSVVFPGWPLPDTPDLLPQLYLRCLLLGKPETERRFWHLPESKVMVLLLLLSLAFLTYDRIFTSD